MDSRSEPLVAVVTPVYQGGGWLTMCLESVRAQDYRNWIHIVVDNASTDTTRQIAESFAASDARVRVLSFDQLLPMFENFNRALAAVPSDAHYVKFLFADDILYPSCLRTMVTAAERDPTVAIVVSRFYEGPVLSPKHAPAHAVRLPGRTVAREALLGTSNILGNPSVSLLRTNRLIDWPSLFRTERFPPDHPGAPPHNQGDKEFLLATLDSENVAFLPEPLVALGNEGSPATSFARRVGGWHPTRVDLLLRRGARFLDEATLRQGVRRVVWKWIRSLAWRTPKQVGWSDPEFCLYQSLCLRDLVPRLRDAGFAREATVLGRFESGLATLGGLPINGPRR